MGICSRSTFCFCLLSRSEVVDIAIGVFDCAFLVEALDSTLLLLFLGGSVNGQGFGSHLKLFFCLPATVQPGSLWGSGFSRIEVGGVGSSGGRSWGLFSVILFSPSGIEFAPVRCWFIEIGFLLMPG